MIDTKLLFDSIVDSIAKIKEELNQLDKGIFFAPELYIAFKIGINIYQNKEKIFNTSNVKWHRETAFLKGSITDLAFEVDDKIIFF